MSQSCAARPVWGRSSCGVETTRKWRLLADRSRTDGAHRTHTRSLARAHTHTLAHQDLQQVAHKHVSRLICVQHTGTTGQVRSDGNEVATRRKHLAREAFVFLSKWWGFKTYRKIDKTVQAINTCPFTSSTRHLAPFCQFLSALEVLQSPPTSSFAHSKKVKCGQKCTTDAKPSASWKYCQLLTLETGQVLAHLFIVFWNLIFVQMVFWACSFSASQSACPTNLVGTLLTIRCRQTSLGRRPVTSSQLRQCCSWTGHWNVRISLKTKKRNTTYFYRQSIVSIDVCPHKVKPQKICHSETGAFFSKFASLELFFFLTTKGNLYEYELAYVNVNSTARALVVVSTIKHHEP